MNCNQITYTFFLLLKSTKIHKNPQKSLIFLDFSAYFCSSFSGFFSFFSGFFPFSFFKFSEIPQNPQKSPKIPRNHQKSSENPQKSKMIFDFSGCNSFQIFLDFLDFSGFFWISISFFESNVIRSLSHVHVKILHSNSS